jgi:hypothetical protein
LVRGRDTPLKNDTVLAATPLDGFIGSGDHTAFGKSDSSPHPFYTLVSTIKAYYNSNR